MSRQILRTALVWNGTVMEEKQLRSGNVTIGNNKKATYIIPFIHDLNELEQYPILSEKGNLYQLKTLDGMSGRLTIGGDEKNIDGAELFRVSPGDWGIVHIGDVSLFFKWVKDDALIAATGLGGTLNFDLITTTFVGAVAHALFLMFAFLTYDPSMAGTEIDIPDRFVSILMDEPPDVIEEIEEEAMEDESMSQRAGGEEGRFGEEEAEQEDSTLPDHDGPMVDHLDSTELGRAFDAAIGATGSLTNIFGSSDAFSNTFGQDFATAGEGDAFVVGRGSGGLGMSGTGGGGGGDGFGRVHGVGDIDTGGGRGHGASLGRREQRAPRARVERGRPSVNGFLSRDQIERVVRRHSRGFRYCYERELADDPELAGRISVNWTIGLDGRVESASVTENSIGSRNVESCIVREVRRMRFDQPDGGMVVVTYPFTFRTGD